MVKADRGDLDRIFMNLISNGIKYNRDKGSLTVRITDAGAAWEVAVIDTGIGMSDAEQASIFQEFYRVKNHKTSGITGTGLGLATVRRVLAGYNGRVAVQSRPGCGLHVHRHLSPGERVMTIGSAPRDRRSSPLAGFFGIFSTTMSKSPVLPLFVKSLSGSETVIGLIAAISPFAGVLFSFPVGMLADRWGKKRLLTVAGGVLLAAPLLYLFVRQPLLAHPDPVLPRHRHGHPHARGLGVHPRRLSRRPRERSSGCSPPRRSSGARWPRCWAARSSRGSCSSAGRCPIGASTWRRSPWRSPLVFLVLCSWTATSRRQRAETGRPGSRRRTSPGACGTSCATGGSSAPPWWRWRRTSPTECWRPTFRCTFPACGVPAYQIGLVFSLQILSIALTKPLFGKLADRVDRRVQILAGIVLLAAATAAIPLVTVRRLTLVSVVFGLAVSISTVATSSYVAEVVKTEQIGASHRRPQLHHGHRPFLGPVRRGHHHHRPQHGGGVSCRGVGVRDRVPVLHRAGAARGRIVSDRYRARRSHFLLNSARELLSFRKGSTFIRFSAQ